MKLFSFGVSTSFVLVILSAALSWSSLDHAVLFATGDSQNQQPRFLRSPAGSPQQAADPEQVVQHMSAPGSTNQYRLSRRLFDEEEPSRKQRQGEDPPDAPGDDDDDDDDDDDGVSLLRSNLLCSLFVNLICCRSCINTTYMLLLIVL